MWPTQSLFSTTNKRSIDPQGQSQAPLAARKEKEVNDNDGAGGVGSC